jgi:hypothetical protein
MIGTDRPQHGIAIRLQDQPEWPMARMHGIPNVRKCLGPHGDDETGGFSLINSCFFTDLGYTLEQRLPSTDWVLH